MTTETQTNVVRITRRINAAAATIFGILCDPANHVIIDGSGMLRNAASRRLTGVGDQFVVEMWNDWLLDYDMTNKIVEFAEDRTIVWEPTLTRTSAPEHQEGVPDSARQLWGFELRAISDTETDVTEVFDCSRSPEWLQEATAGGEKWREAIDTSLAKLAELAS